MLAHAYALNQWILKQNTIDYALKILYKIKNSYTMNISSYTIETIFSKISSYLTDLDKLVEWSYYDSVNVPKKPGVYLISFSERLQYIGSTNNLSRRIKNDLMNGSATSHTLVSKLIKTRNAKAFWLITGFLKSNAKIKFIETDNEKEAKLIEDFLILLYDPPFNETFKSARASHFTY